MGFIRLCPVWVLVLSFKKQPGTPSTCTCTLHVPELDRNQFQICANTFGFPLSAYQAIEFYFGSMSVHVIIQPTSESNNKSKVLPFSQLSQFLGVFSSKQKRFIHIHTLPSRIKEVMPTPTWGLTQHMITSLNFFNRHFALRTRFRPFS